MANKKISRSFVMLVISLLCLVSWICASYLIDLQEGLNDTYGGAAVLNIIPFFILPFITIYSGLSFFYDYKKEKRDMLVVSLVSIIGALLIGIPLWWLVFARWFLV